MKIFLFMIYVSHHLLISTEGYATNQVCEPLDFPYQREKK